MNARGSDNNNGINDLMVAASRGDLSRVETLLRRGAYPDAQNATGWTALMIAERKGHAEGARLLRQGKVEKPLPSFITSASAGDDLDLSEFPEQIKD